jgi:hypothetical protein
MRVNVRRRRNAGPGIWLAPLLLLTMIVVATAVFIRPRAADLIDPRGADQVGGNSSTVGPSFSIGSRRTETIAPTRGTEARNESFRSATKLQRNHAAGYSFRYPEDWQLDADRSVSKVTRPDRHFVISFGLGPKGGLPVAYDELVALLDETYANVVVHKVGATHVGGRVGVIVRGAASGSSGRRVRFLATVIERPKNQRAVGALAATDMSSAKFPKAVREILASLRPI